MERHAEENERDNPLECLAQLTAHIVTDYMDRHTLGRWIATALNPSREYDEKKAQQILSMYGIVVKEILSIGGDEPKKMVCIRNGSPNVDAIFRGTKWRELGWEGALRRLDGAGASRDPIRFSNNSNDKRRATTIPAHHFTDEPIHSEFREF
jgi:hypothetical protein